MNGTEEMIKITYDGERCTRCGRCVRVCPMGVLATQRGEVPQAVNERACISCGHCLDVCDAAALSHSGIDSARVRPVRRELLPTAEQLMELIRSRRSNRALTQQPIPEATMQDILEAARYAPTAENSRRVRLTVIRDDAQLQRLEDSVMRFFLLLSKLLMNPLMRPLTKRLLPDLYNEAPELVRFERLWRQGKRPCLCNCPTLIAFSAPSGYDFASDDSNLAYQNASLMAEAHGISQIYMGLIQTALKFMGKAKQRRLLGIPQGHKLCALMGLGVPAFRYSRYVER